MSCKIFFSKFLKRIGLLWIFLFFSFAYSQDIIEISQLNAINVPAAAPPSPIALSATCPTSSYELGVTIRNNSGAPINFAATSLNISLTLTGVNASVSNTTLGGGSLNAGNSRTVTFSVDLSNPGFNTFTVSISGAAIGTESSTDLDDNIAAATITSNPIPSTATLNSSAGTNVCEGDIVTISSGGGSTYHFFLNGAPLTANPTNDSSFSMTTLSNGDKISIRVVDVSGCISTNSMTFTVNQTPNSGGGGTLVDMQGSVPGEVEESTEFQIDRIQISNSSSASDKYYATVNGVLYTYTSVGVETPTTIAIGLADQIDDDGNIGSAVPNSGAGGAGSIEVTSNAKGMSYPITVSKSPGASSNIGTQLIQAGTTFTICNAATDILATGPSSVASYSFTLGGVPKALKGGQTSITTLTPPISSPVILEVTGFTTNLCSSKKSVNIVVNSLTSAGSISGNQTICSGGNPGVISSLASATGSGNITYSWWAYPADGLGWAELSPKVTTPEYDPPSLTVSTTFRRRAISTLNNKVCFTDSSVVTVTVAPALAGGSLNTTTQTICSLGDPANMIVGADTAAAADISYQWELSVIAANAGFSAITGITSASYDPPSGVVTQTTWYRRAIIRKDGGTELCRAYSDVKELTVNTNDPGLIPATLEVCINQGTTIGSLSDAIGNGGSAVVTYQWKRNTGSWVNAAGVNNAKTYDLPAAIYNSAGTYTFRRDAIVGTCSATSNIITVTVHAALNGGSATTGTTTICTGGDPANLTVGGGGTGPGAGISYLWQTSPNNLDPWTNTAATTQAYDPAAGSQTTDLYYRRAVIRSDGLGVELCRANSTSVLVTLNSITAGTISSSVTNVCNGDTPPLLSSLTPALADGTLTYQWVSRTRPSSVDPWGAWAGAGAGSTSSTFQPGALTLDTQFIRGAVSTDGALACSVSSTAITILVNPVISTAISTSSQTVCLGDVPAPLSFAGAATGAGYTNQWFESDDNITYNPIAGAFGTAYAPDAPSTTKFYKLQTTYNNGATTCTVTSTGSGGIIIVTVSNSAPSAPDITPTTGTISNTFQVTRINIGGAPSVGDKYNVSINGTTYTHTVGLGATSISNVAVGLANILVPDGNIGSAIPNGAAGAGTIELTASTAGSVFITKTSSSFGASGSVGYQLIKGSKLITICVADLGVASLTATSTVLAGLPSYDFKINNSAEADAPDGRMLIPAGMADSVLVTTRATSNTCFTDFAVNVVVNRVTAGSIGASVSICPTADPDPFTSLSAATAPAGANITYQWWSKPFAGAYADTGATGEIYDIPGGLVVSTTYKRIAVSNLNGLTCTIDSNEIDVIIQPALVPGVATTGTTTICSGGDPANITVGDGGGPARTAAGLGISFLWQTSPNNLDPWTDTAITTEAYDPAAGSQTTDLYYRRAVIRSDGLGVELCRANSTSVLVTLNSITAGTITTTLTTVCNGDTPNIITSLTPALADGTRAYKWVKRTRPSSVDPWGAWVVAGGADTNETYQPGPLTLDTEFIRGATSTDGALTCSVSSTAIRIIVNPVISTAISTSSQTVCLGDVPAPLSFAGAATGAGYTNQWFESEDNVVYNPIAGAFGTAYSPDAPITTKFYKLQTTYNNGATTCTVTSTGSGGIIIVTVSNSAPSAPDITPTSGTISNTFQVTSLNLTGNPTVGDKYNIIINGNIITETAVGGDTAFSIADRLDNKIALNGAIGSAVASGAGAAATISITANTAGSVFTTRTSASSGASLGMGLQIVTGSKLITFCVADLGVASLTATSTVSAGLPSYDFKINGSPAVDTPDGTMLIPAGMPDSVLITTRATSNTCFIDFAVNVVVNRVTAGSIGTSDSICINDDPAAFTSLSLATAPAGANLTYQWWVRSDGGTWTNTGDTGAVYDAGSLSVSTTYKRIAVSNLNGQICTIESNQVTITAEPELVPGVATTGTTTICSGGDPANITVGDGGGPARTAAGAGISFLWQTSPNNLDPWTDTAITTEAYDPAAGSQTTDLYYRRVVIRSNGLTELCRANSTSVLVNLNSITAGTITSTVSTICNGDTPPIITNLTEALADATRSYKWYSRSRPSSAAPYGPWAAAGGADTLNSYQPSALTSDTQFIREATSTDGALACTVSSSIIEIKVNPASNLATASPDQVICSGGSPSQLTFVGANTGPGYVNQWLESDDNITYNPIPGAFGIAYSPPALTAAKFYKLQTTYTNGGISCTTSTTGSTGIISVTINLAPNSPNITATSGVVTNTKQVTRISVNGVPNTGDSYSVTLNGTLLTSVVAGVGSTSLQIAQALDDIIQAEAVIGTAIAGGAAAAANIEITALTPGVTFTINTSSSAGSGASIGLQNITGSKKITFCLADLGVASITAQALGPAGIDYDLFIDGNPVADTAGSILVPAGMPDNVVVTARATSNTCSIEFIANVSVNRIDGGTIGSDQTICSNEDLAPFTNIISASGPPGSTVVKYEWYIDNVKDGVDNFTKIPGVDTAVLDYGSLTASATFYRVPIIDLDGVFCNPPDAAGNASLSTPNRSNLIEITVSTALVAGTISQTNELVCMGLEGDPIPMTVNGGTPAGATIRFQWQRSTASALGPFTDIPGVTTAGYDPPANLGTSTWFRREIIQIEPGGAEKCSAFTNPRLVEVNTVTGGTINGTQDVCSGSIPTLFGSTVDGTSNTGVPFNTGVVNYQWQSSTDGFTWINAAGVSTNSTYQAGAITQSTQYRRLATGTIAALTCPTGLTTVTSNIITVTRRNNVGQPQLIRANYSGANTGNSGNGIENIISKGGTIYNNSACGTPLIESFDPCPVGNATGYEYSFSPPDAGSIDPNTGVVTWTAGWTGDVTVRIRAKGCGGVSPWTTTTFEVASSTINATAPTIPIAFEQEQVKRIYLVLQQVQQVIGGLYILMV